MEFLRRVLGKRESSASIAKERLHIILAHERAGRGAPDYLPALKEELLEVIAKYVPIRQEDMKVHLERQDECEVLELNIVLPEAPHHPRSR